MTIFPQNVFVGVTEGQSVSDSQGGALFGDFDTAGLPMSVTAVSAGSASKTLTGGPLSIQGSYGTLVMNANGTYSYAASSHVSFPSNGALQDTFTLSIGDGHGGTAQATLTVFVLPPGMLKVGGAFTSSTIGDAPTFFDASAGFETVRAGNGNDVFFAGSFDTVTAGNGNNIIAGASANFVTFRLGDGTNTVTARDFAHIVAGNGNNTVSAGGAATIQLGDGVNKVSAAGFDNITVGKGNNTVTAGDFTQITAGDGSNAITAGGFAHIVAGNGNNTVTGGSFDTVSLGGGANKVAAGDFSNVTAGNGNNTIAGGNFDTITLGGGANKVAAGDFANITAGDGGNTITGGAFAHIVAGKGNNTVTGGANDTISLGNGNNSVVGGAGDLITVGNGNDTITVGASDRVVLGTGADTLIFAQTTASSIGHVTIDGFNAARDHLQFNSSLFPNLAAALAHASQVGANTVIRLDANDAITLTNVPLTSLLPSTGPTVTINAVDGNNVINFSEAHAAGGVGVSGSITGLAANSTFQVKVTDGVFSKTYTATVNGAGTSWTATIPSSDATTLANGSATVSVQVTDSSGRTATASQIVTVAETLPTVSINAVDGSNVINFSEAHAAGGVPLGGSVTGLTANGTFQVTVTDGAFNKSYTATVNAAGTAWTATIPSSDAATLANGTATVSAQVTDAFGNQSTLVSHTLAVAETLPTVSINAVDGNNVINFSEAHAAGGVPLGGSVTGLTANSTFQVTVTDGAFNKSYTATVNAAGTAWTATIPSSDAATLANGTATVSAQVTDAFGNQSTLVSHTLAVAETLPTVSINAVDGNNVINFSEAHAAGGVPLGGSVTGLTANGTFQVTVTDGAFNKSYTATVNAAGTGWTAAIPSSDATTLANGTATVSAQVTDAFGNQSTLVSRTLAVAETLPTVSINAVDGNNVINFSEAHAAGGVPLGGSVTGLTANSTFQVTVTDGAFNKSYTATVNAAGTAWTATIPSSDAATLANGTATVSAQVTDSFGNQSTLVSHTLAVAETLPTVSINAVDGNNVINFSEAHAAGGVPLGGSVTGLTANSTFQVTVTDGAFNKSYTATVNAAGTAWTATIPSSDATTLANGTATVSAQVTDAFGNQSAIASQSVAVAESITSYVWTGLGNGDWADPNDWNALAVPPTGSQVLVGLASGAQAAITTNAGSISSLNLSGAGQLIMPSSSSALEIGTFTNSGNLTIQQGQLTVDGALHNSGAIAIASAGTATISDAAELTSNSPDLVIDGGGTITLSNTLTPFAQSFLNSTGNDRLAPMQASVTHPSTTLENVDNTISGAGHIGVGVVTSDAIGDAFVNDQKGVVKVTGTDYVEINSVTVVNHGLIEAQGSNGALPALDFSTHFVDTLNAGSVQITQRGLYLTSDGTILADGPGSEINFRGTIIHGGTLQTENGGSMTFLKSGLSADTKVGGVSNAAMLDGTTTPVTLTGANSTTLGTTFVFDETFMLGSIVNHSFMGIIGNVLPQQELDAGFSDRTGALALSGNVTLSGGGTINLERPSKALRNSLDVGIISELTSNAYVLTNVDNTISGAGTIGYAPNLINLTAPPATRLTIVNESAGSILASSTQFGSDDPLGDRLDLVNLNLTNRGLVSSTNTGGMLIQGSTIDNTGGTISANSSDATLLDMESSAVTGGALTAESPQAAITVGGSSTLTDVAITADANASVSIQNSTVAGSAIEADGDGSSVTVTNSTLSDSADSPDSIVAKGKGSSVTLNNDNLTSTQAQFEVDSGGSLTFNGHYDASSATFSGSGGKIDITDGSSLKTAGTMSVNALYSIGTSSTLEMNDLENGTATFAGVNGKILLDASQILPSGAIVNFVQGDSIDLTNFDSNSAQVTGYSGNSSSGVLTIADQAGDTANLTLVFDQPAAFASPNDPTADFSLQDDGSGGVLLTDDFGLSSPASTIQNAADPNNVGNSGPWTIGPSGDAPNITIGQDTTLQGGGSVELVGGSIMSGGSIATFTNLDNTIGGSGTIGDSNLALYNAPSGVIDAISGDSLSIDATGTRNAGLIEADGGSINVTNDVDDWYGQGVVSAQNGGSIIIGGTLSGRGQNEIGANATLEAGTVADGNTTFTGSDGMFILDHSANLGISPGTVSDFLQGDQIDLRDITAGANATLDYSGTAAGGTLTVSDGTDAVSLALFGNYLAPTGAPTAAHFTATSDGTPGGTLITTNIVAHA